MLEQLLAFISAFVPLFVIIDPFVSVPVFCSMLGKRRDYAQIALEASVVAFAILVIFTLLGEPLLQLLRISMGSFRIAGGLLLLYLSFEMFIGKLSSTKRAAKAIGAVPIGTPMLAGPGAISTAILLASTPGIGLIYTLLAILVVCALTYVILSNARAIYNALGENDFIVLTRIMGLIAAAIALEFIRLGLLEWGALS